MSDRHDDEHQPRHHHDDHHDHQHHAHSADGARMSAAFDERYRARVAMCVASGRKAMADRAFADAAASLEAAEDALIEALAHAGETHPVCR